MKKFFASALVVAAFVAVPVSVFAVEVAVQTDARASIINAIELAAGADVLDFGMISTSGNAGSVTVSHEGSRTISGGVTTVGTDFSPASFVVTGQAGETFSINLPTSFDVTDGSNTMEVDAISTENLTVTIPAAGEVTFFVGATLKVDANQPAGDYIGQLEVSVNYN